tara:strand:+ start:6446 stop:15547 length:9102 start_codon:yes stop_codon:yes gene_type:complete
MGQIIDFGGPLGSIEFPDNSTDQQIQEIIQSDNFLDAAEATGYDVTPLLPPQPSWVGDILVGIDKGVEQTKGGYSTAFYNLGMKDSTELARSLAKSNTAIQSSRFSRSVQQDMDWINEEEDPDASSLEQFLTASGKIILSPRASIAMLAQSAVSSAPGLVAMAAGLAASGLTAGASAVAGYAAMGANSGAIEYSNVLVDTAYKYGYDVTDDESLEKFLADPVAMDEARRRGTLKGVSVALFDGLSGFFAGKLFGPVTKFAIGRNGREVQRAAGLAAAQSAAQAGKNPKAILQAARKAETGSLTGMSKLAGRTAEAISQGLTGVAGEGVGSVLADGKVSGAAMAWEFWLEMGTGAGEIAIAQLGKNRGPKTAEDILKDLGIEPLDTDPATPPPDGSPPPPPQTTQSGDVEDLEAAGVGMGVSLPGGIQGRVRSRIGDQFLVVNDLTGEGHMMDVSSTELRHLNDLNPEQTQIELNRASSAELSGGVPLEQRLTPTNIARIVLGPDGTVSELENEVLIDNENPNGYEDLRDYALGMNITPEQKAELEALVVGTKPLPKAPSINLPWEYLNLHGERKLVDTPLGVNTDKIIGALNVPNAPEYTPNDIHNGSVEELKERVAASRRLAQIARTVENDASNEAKRRMKKGGFNENDNALAVKHDENVKFLDQKLRELDALKVANGQTEKFFSSVPDDVRKKPTKTKLGKVKVGPLAALAIEQGIPSDKVFDALGKPLPKAKIIEAIIARHQADIPLTHNEPVKPDPRRAAIENRRTRAPKAPPIEQEPVASAIDYEAPEIFEDEEPQAVPTATNAAPTAGIPDDANDAAPLTEEEYTDTIYPAEEEVPAATPPVAPELSPLPKGNVPFTDEGWELMLDAWFPVSMRPHFFDNGIPGDYIQKALRGSVWANGKWNKATVAHVKRIQSHIIKVNEINAKVMKLWEASNKNHKGYVKDGPQKTAVLKELGLPEKRITWANYTKLITVHMTEMGRMHEGIMKQVQRANPAVQLDLQLPQNTGRGGANLPAPPTVRELIEVKFDGPASDIAILKERFAQLDQMATAGLQVVNRHEGVLRNLARTIGMFNPSDRADPHFVLKVREDFPEYSGFPAATTIGQWRGIFEQGRDRAQANIDPFLNEMELIKAQIAGRTTPTDIIRTPIEEEVAFDVPIDGLELTADEEAELQTFLATPERREMRAEGIPAPRVHTPSFVKWFGNSEVVDENGKPLVVYNGTNKEVFFEGPGPFFLSPDTTVADYFATDFRPDGSANIIPTFVSLQNPLVVDAIEEGLAKEDQLWANDARKDALINRARISGKYDGIIIRGLPEPIGFKNRGDYDFRVRSTADVIVVFNSDQIKSIFDPDIFIQGTPASREMRVRGIDTSANPEFVNEFNALARENAMKPSEYLFHEVAVWISNDGTTMAVPDEGAHGDVANFLSPEFKETIPSDDGSGFGIDAIANTVAQQAGAIRIFWEGEAVDISTSNVPANPEQLRAVSNFIRAAGPDKIYIDIVDHGKHVSHHTLLKPAEALQLLKSLPSSKELRIPRHRPTLVPAVRVFGQVYAATDGTHSGAEIRAMSENNTTTFGNIASDTEHGYIDTQTNQFMSRNDATLVASLYGMLKPNVIPVGVDASTYPLTPDMLATHATPPGRGYTTKFERRKQQVLETARQIAAQMGVDIPIEVATGESPNSRGANAGLRPQDVVAAYYEDYMIHVSVETLDNILDPNPDAHVIGHELIHYLKDAKILNDQEWAILARDAAKENWIGKFNIVERYPNESYEVQLEEAVAEKFGEYLVPLFNPENSGWKPEQVGILGKIKKWLQAMASSLGMHGFHKASDIFQDIYNGSLSKREAQYSLVSDPISKEIRLPNIFKGTKDLEKINEGNDHVTVPPQMNKVNYYASSPRYIAQKDTTKHFTKFWWTGKKMKQYFTGIVNESVTALKPYGKAVRDPKMRDDLRKAMEMAQMREVPENGIQIVEPKDEKGISSRVIFVNGPSRGQGHHSTLRPNEVVTLEGDSLAAYRSVRVALDIVMSHMIESHLSGNMDNIKEWWAKIDPIGSSSFGTHLRELINPENASDIQHIIQDLNLGYIIQDGVRVPIQDDRWEMGPLITVDEKMKPITGWLTLFDYIHDMYDAQIADVEAEHAQAMVHLEAAKALKNAPAITDWAEKESALASRINDLILSWDDGLALVQGSFETYEKFLKNEHYAPVMRFGQYFISMRDASGKVVYYSQVEINPFANAITGRLHIKKKIEEAIADAKRAFPELAPMVVNEDDETGEGIYWGENNLDSLRNDLKINQGLDYLRNHARVGNVDQLTESVSVEGKSQTDAYNQLRGVNDIMEDVTNSEARESLITARDAATGKRRDLLNELVETSLFKKRSAGFAKQLWQPRKHTAGYSVDFERAIASYITGAARHASKMQYQPKLEAQLNIMADAKIPKLYKYAKVYNKYIMDPVEEHRFLRALGFQWWLGGNFSSAILQTMSAIQFTAPMLGARTGIGNVRAEKEVAIAFKQASRMLIQGFKEGVHGNPDFRDMFISFAREHLPKDFQTPEFFADIMRALNEGILKNHATMEEQGLSPHVRRLQIMMGSGLGGGLDARLKGLTTLATSPFNTMEAMTRFVTYAVNHRAARDPAQRAKIIEFMRGTDNLFDVMLEGKPIEEFTPHMYAVFAVEESMGVYGKTNRAVLMRSHLAPVMQFQQYPLMMFELMSRMAQHHGVRGKQALANILIMAAVTGGLFGLPLVDDLDDMYDWAYKVINAEDPMIRKKIRDMFYDVGNGFGRLLGQEDTSETSALVADILEHGIFGAIGIDAQRRVSVQYPGVDILKAAVGIQGDVDDLLGLPGSTWLSGTKSFISLYRAGRTGEAIPYALPAAIRNVYQGFSWNDIGVRTQRGQQIMTPEEYQTLSPWLRGAKGFGFSPLRVRQERDIAYNNTRLNSVVKSKQNMIVSRMAAAIVLEQKPNATKKDIVASRARMAELVQEIIDHNTQVIDNSQDYSYLLPFDSMLESAMDRSLQTLRPDSNLSRINTRARREALRQKQLKLR